MKLAKFRSEWRRFIFWCTSAVVGVGAVEYSRLISYGQSLYFYWFHLYPHWVSLATPALFLIAAMPVAIFAPEAKGSGIPQVLAVIDASKKSSSEAWNSSNVSIKTTFVKICSSFLGVLAGASVGREGPTIQISASIFSWVGRKTKNWLPNIHLDAFLIAGGAAGVSAAFNTPLAGITFALEEIAEHNFAGFKRMTIASVIIAGIVSQALAGNYLYFGHPNINPPTNMLLLDSIVIGLIAGGAGGIFAFMIANPLKLLPKTWWLRALLCGTVCSVIAFYFDAATSGSGYEPTENFMNATTMDFPKFFTFAKFTTTIFSYYSGIAGGIFAPSLSIGASVGVWVGQTMNIIDLRACALIAMVGFFSGAIQAPLTGIIIVMEMTDQHKLILPFLISGFLAQRVGQFFLPESLYRVLAKRISF